MRAERLVAYQNRAYADRYLEAVGRVRAAETKAAAGSTRLTEAFARSLFKLMAYKDEYEVARLHVDPGFAREIAENFEGDYRITYHLAPPLLARRDPIDRPAAEAGVRRLHGRAVWRVGAAQVPARHAV